MVCAGAGEIVEGGGGRLDDVFGYKGGAFGGALLGALDAAFPFQYGPAWKIVLGELREDSFEVDLAIAQRAESSGAIDPGLKASVDALAACRKELGILHVKHFNAVVIEVDVLEIVELLDDEVARIVEEVAARVIVEALEKHFESDSVVEIFTGVDLEAEVDVGFVEGVEDWTPAGGEFVEGSLDESSGALRPWVEVGPCERAGKCYVGSKAEIGGRFGSEAQLLDGPGLAGFRIAAEFGWGESVEGDVVRGMYRDELTL